MMTINLDIDLTDYFTEKYTIAKEIINIKQSINNMIMENVTVDIVSKTIDAVDESIVTVSETIDAVDETVATTVSETVDAVDESIATTASETVDILSVC